MRPKRTSYSFSKEKKERENITQQVAIIPPRLTLKSTLTQNSQNTQVYYATQFNQLPISRRTLFALTDNSYQYLTAIQKKALPLALRGNDVLGAARTGSGKTLTFLIPILELLWRLEWTHWDGLGALIISPTRELAMQIFQVLRKVGKNHSLSAGLVIGGTDFEEERERIGRMNILIATPGRLLQHMDQSTDFDCSRLQILVLDEADQILDMGFERTIDAILRNLPKQRQTLLFSATQTRSVQALARLSLKEPEYVAVYERNQQQHSEEDSKEEEDVQRREDSFVDIPFLLKQSYAIVEAPEKLNILWSFIKSHVRCKIIVFLASCKQVRFVYESFRRMKPGLVLLHIHGRMKQSKRMNMYQQFCGQSYACLLATDVAARGLDFPHVDWVIQVDCPSHVQSYVHRIGRTARMNRSGNSLLFLLPSELDFLERLKSHQIEPKKHVVNRKKTRDISGTLASLNASDVSLKYLSQRALCCYIRSIALEGDKQIFDASQLPINEMTSAYGLVTLPKYKIPKAAIRNETSRNAFGYRRENTQEAVELQLEKPIFPLTKNNEEEEEEEEEEWLHPVDKEKKEEEEDWMELIPSWKAQELEQTRRVERRKGKPRNQAGSPSLLADLGESEEKEVPSTIDEYAQRVRDKLQSQLEYIKQVERNRVKEMHKKRKRLQKNDE
ncbi:hypothetical protein GpartN1_g6176.t1 [Galdieria partita]|uniref:ATP-dependent RNA helicase n=1 Tax=Galdieria partita TaxID=83374 RepID=A0A9C7Q1X5_9RHOD|nr:hypothetical protein GpartN1_g6176.t1 [Galdieria partita]